jgi:tRNA(Ile)-lysidine synthetase-like protein
MIVLTGRPLSAIGRFVESKPSAAAFSYPLPIPGEVELPGTGSVIAAETASGVSGSALMGTPRLGISVQPPELVSSSSSAARHGGRLDTVVVRRDLCGTALAVRNRRPGDWFRPIGLGGRKKLQDFFVDRKVERRQRDSIPLVVDESDRIVWVAGHAVSDEFRVTDPAQAVIILRLKGVGGAV